MQVSSSSTFKAKKSFILLKDTLNALGNFDNRQEIVKLLICKIMYIYIYIYIHIYSESVFNTLYTELKHKCWKNFFWN